MPVLDPTFNVIVAEFAPARFLYTDSQYPDYAAMRADYLRTGILKINVDHSENTIFGAASVNWQFRAWHDICHILADADFSPEGERAAAELQKSQIRARYGASRDAYRWSAIVDAEVSGQLAYYLAHGTFPTDQYAYVREYLYTRNGLMLPLDSHGWEGGFAVKRIQERRAAEIAPALVGDAMQLLKDEKVRARRQLADAADRLAGIDSGNYDGPRGLSRAVCSMTGAA